MRKHVVRLMQKGWVWLLGLSLACTADIQKPNASVEPLQPANYGDKKVATMAAEALAFCKQQQYNKQFCVFVDMGLHSGNKRLFIWDFEKQQSIGKAMVSHGCGQGAWARDDSRSAPVFSNVPESHCSALGKYKIGERGYSQWGIHVKYLLHGLDSTNNNALKRHIVLHSWEHVPNNETYPKGIAESWGCPAVSNDFMYQLDSLLKKAPQPTLLWMVQ